VTTPALARPETVAVALEADAPWFAGHFPGAPILPGVAHLVLVERALSGLLGTPMRIAAVPSLRLRVPLGPGDGLTLRLSPAGENAVRFEIRRAAELASQGTILGAPAPAALPPDARLDAARPNEERSIAGPDSRRADPAALLPHAPPARLVEEILEHRADALAVRARIPPGGPFAEGPVASGVVALELAAQAAAALEALERAGRGEPGGPRRGFLVGAREARWVPTLLPVDSPLEVRVALEARALPLSHYRFEVAGHATGIVATFLSAETR
jgi:3-hydroxymyristoyl/3-hydroxydecanoyl-(acyl carrier protein) dehydratase